MHSGALTAGDQNVSGHDWIDKQPIRATEHVTSLGSLKENASNVSVTSLKVRSHGRANPYKVHSQTPLEAHFSPKKPVSRIDEVIFKNIFVCRKPTDPVNSGPTQI